MTKFMYCINLLHFVISGKFSSITQFWCLAKIKLKLCSIVSPKYLLFIIGEVMPDHSNKTNYRATCKSYFISSWRRMRQA